MCVAVYLCLLTATLVHFSFILSSLLHGSPFVLSKIFMGFLSVLQTDVLFHPDMRPLYSFLKKENAFSLSILGYMEGLQR